MDYPNPLYILEIISKTFSNHNSNPSYNPKSNPNHNPNPNYNPNTNTYFNLQSIIFKADFVYLKKVKVKMLQNYEKPENLQLINKYSK